MSAHGAYSVVRTQRLELHSNEYGILLEHQRHALFSIGKIFFSDEFVACRRHGVEHDHRRIPAPEALHL